jgi:hypothetical protein
MPGAERVDRQYWTRRRWWGIWSRRAVCSRSWPGTVVRCSSGRGGALRWKVACGLSLDYEGFHPTTLTYWRRRLAASDRPDRIFAAVRAVVAATGVLGGKTMRGVPMTSTASYYLGSSHGSIQV